MSVHVFFFFNDTATTEIYTLSLHDALPISARADHRPHAARLGRPRPAGTPRSLRRDVDEGDPGGAPPGVRGLRSRASPRGASGGGGGGGRLLPSRGRGQGKVFYLHLMPYVLGHGETPARG